MNYLFLQGLMTFCMSVKIFCMSVHMPIQTFYFLEPAVLNYIFLKVNHLSLHFILILILKNLQIFKLQNPLHFFSLYQSSQRFVYFTDFSKEPALVSVHLLYCLFSMSLIFTLICVLTNICMYI